MVVTAGDGEAAFDALRMAMRPWSQPSSMKSHAGTMRRAAWWLP